jgi:hypothetical protein
VLITMDSVSIPSVPTHVIRSGKVVSADGAGNSGAVVYCSSMPSQIFLTSEVLCATWEGTFITGFVRGPISFIDGTQNSSCTPWGGHIDGIPRIIGRHRVEMLVRVIPCHIGLAATERLVNGSFVFMLAVCDGIARPRTVRRKAVSSRTVRVVVDGWA